MTAHSDGNGSSWNETLDVDQPHGLDYQEFNDFRIGVRLRMASGHTDFADNTVGGIHKPGGAGILGMEITDAGGDITAPIVSDGTYQGRGLVWAWDGSQDARLWCSTEAAESTAATDFTVMMLNPDKQWGGRDVTWNGQHSFLKDVSIAESLYVENSADVSDFASSGDSSMSGYLIVDGSFGPTTCFTDSGGFLDEDDMASDASASFPSQQSVKAYVANNIKTFGVWNDRDKDGGADSVLTDTEYTAATDGFVVASQVATGAGILSLDMQTPTATSRPGSAFHGAATTGNKIFAMMPVKKGDTWKVVTTASGGNDTTLVMWMPLGT
jgi:hypothetical protein